MTNEKRTHKKELTNRAKRTPVGTRNVLSAKGRPGFVQRWVNDVDDRLSIFQDAGYTFVLREDANTSDSRAQDPSQMGASVKKSVGNGVTAYLMEIPEDFYKEDQILKQQRNDEIEASYDPKGLTKDKYYYGHMIKN